MKNFTFLKTLFSLCLISFLSFSAQAQCDYTLEMADSWGDGWNGNTMDVLVNGVEVINDIEAADQGGGNNASIETVTFTVNDGDNITTLWNGGGTYGGETSYRILDAIGAEVGTGAQTSITTPIVASCPSCIPLTATFASLTTCTGNNFAASIDVTDIGQGAPYTLTDDQGTASMTISAVGMITFGDYPASTTVNFTITATGDPACSDVTGSITTPASAVCNEACADAVAITVFADATAGAAGASVVESGSTADGPAGPFSCHSAGGENDDVWYSFAAPAVATNKLVITTTTLTGSTDWAMVIYDACAGSEIACSDDVNGLMPEIELCQFDYIPGATYYVRIFTYSSSAFTTGTCNLFVYEDTACPAPPPNNACADAIAIPDCTAPVSGTTELATASGAANPSCDLFGTINDVYYSFTTGTASNTTYTITVSNSTGTIESAVYEGNCTVSTATQVASSCGSGDRTIVLDGLTASTDHIVRVWSNSAATTGTFDICIESEVSNDECGDAIDINGGAANGIPGSATGNSTVGATMSTDVNSCGGDPNDDVWFEFTTDTDGGDATITITEGASFVAVCEVFSGACGGLVSEGCGGATTALTGLAANTQYFVRVFDSSSNFNGDGANERDAGGFDIAVAGSALPADLTSFTGKAMDKYNTLKWETASEQNTSEFAIERSLDGRNNWEVIGTERAAGNSDEVLTYSFDDMRPVSQAYYRLNTVDLDGSSQVSSIVSIKREATGFDVVLVAPNPTNAITSVTFESLNDAKIEAMVTDITGKVISTLTQDAIRGLNNMTIDLSNTPSGVYFLTMNNGVNNITRRIVKN